MTTHELARKLLECPDVDVFMLNHLKHGEADVITEVREYYSDPGRQISIYVESTSSIEASRKNLAEFKKKHGFTS